jgi:hypothetical protein
MCSRPVVMGDHERGFNSQNLLVDKKEELSWHFIKPSIQGWKVCRGSFVDSNLELFKVEQKPVDLDN